MNLLHWLEMACCTNEYEAESDMAQCRLRVIFLENAKAEVDLSGCAMGRQHIS